MKIRAGIFYQFNFFQEYGGTGKSFLDCKDSQLEKLQKPPLTVWTLKGGHPMVRYEKKINVFDRFLYTFQKFQGLLSI